MRRVMRSQMQVCSGDLYPTVNPTSPRGGTQTPSWGEEKADQGADPFGWSSPRVGNRSDRAPTPREQLRDSNVFSMTIASYVVPEVEADITDWNVETGSEVRLIKDGYVLECYPNIVIDAKERCHDGSLRILLIVPNAALKSAIDQKGSNRWGMSFVSLPSLTVTKRPTDGPWFRGSEECATPPEEPAPAAPHTFRLLVSKPLKCVLRSHGEQENTCADQAIDEEELSRWDLSVEDDFAQFTITNLRMEYCDGKGEAVMDEMVLEDLRPASQRPMIPVPQNLDELEEDTIRAMLGEMKEAPKLLTTVTHGKRYGAKQELRIVFDSSTNSSEEADILVLIPGLKLEWDHHTVSALRYFLEGYQKAVQEAATHAMIKTKDKLMTIRCKTGVEMSFTGKAERLVTVRAERFRGIHGAEYRSPHSILDAMELKVWSGGTDFKVQCLFGTLAIMRKLPNVNTQYQMRNSGGMVRMLDTALFQFEFLMRPQAVAAREQKCSKEFKLVLGNWNTQQATSMVYHHDMWMDFMDYVAGYGVMGAMFPTYARRAHDVCRRIRSHDPDWHAPFKNLTVADIYFTVLAAQELRNRRLRSEYKLKSWGDMNRLYTSENVANEANEEVVRFPELQEMRNFEQAVRHTEVVKTWHQLASVSHLEQCSRKLLVEVLDQAGLCGVQVGTMLRQADDLDEVNGLLCEHDTEVGMFTPMELEFARQVLADFALACGTKARMYWKGHTVVTLPTSRSPLRPHRIELKFGQGLTIKLHRGVCTRPNGNKKDTFDKLDLKIELGVVEGVDHHFGIEMHDNPGEPPVPGSAPLPQLEIGRLGKPYDSSCWYTWFTLTCSECYRDFQLHYWQQSDLNQFRLNVTNFVHLECCFSTGTQIELSRIGNNFARANNWRWYPWSTSSGTGTGPETRMSSVEPHSTLSDERNPMRMTMMPSDDLNQPLYNARGQQSDTTGGGGEVKEDGNPTYYVAEGMSLMRMDVTAIWPWLGLLNRTCVVAPYDRCGWPAPGDEMKHPGWVRTLWMLLWTLITMDMLAVWLASFVYIAILFVCPDNIKQDHCQTFVPTLQGIVHIMLVVILTPVLGHSIHKRWSRAYASCAAWAAYIMITLTLNEELFKPDSDRYGNPVDSLGLVVLVVNIWSTVLVPLTTWRSWDQSCKFARIVRLGVNNNHVDKVTSIWGSLVGFLGAFLFTVGAVYYDEQDADISIGPTQDVIPGHSVSIDAVCRLLLLSGACKIGLLVVIRYKDQLWPKSQAEGDAMADELRRIQEEDDEETVEDQSNLDEHEREKARLGAFVKFRLALGFFILCDFCVWIATGVTLGSFTPGPAAQYEVSYQVLRNSMIFGWVTIGWSIIFLATLWFYEHKVTVHLYEFGTGFKQWMRIKLASDLSNSPLVARRNAGVTPRGTPPRGPAAAPVHSLDRKYEDDITGMYVAL